MRKREEAQRMLEAIGEIREELVEAAAEAPRRNEKQHWGGILAAVLALAVVTPALALLLQFAGGMGSHASGVPVNYDGNVYQSYRGPVFPLTAAGETGSVTAERNITLDFSTYLTREENASDGTRYNTEDAAAIITDTYTLHNDSSEPMSLELLYPYQSAGTKEAAGEIPEIRVDGEPVESTLLLGRETDMQSSWEGYQTLVGENTVLASEPLSADTPVTVYTFSDVTVQGDSGARFQLRVKETADSGGVFTAGLDGAIRQPEGSEYGWLYTGSLGEADTAQVVVVHGKLDGYKLYAYDDPNTTAEAAVTETETTLDAALRDVINRELSWNPDQTQEETDWLQSVLLSGALEAYLSGGDGLLSADMGNLLWADRIFYRAFRAEIPAGGALTVSVCQTKEPSGTAQNDPVQAEAGNGADGYDMVTAMGSKIPITALTAQLKNCEAVEIRDQSFGFDPEKGVYQVILDLKEPEYYINVTKK